MANALNERPSFLRKMYKIWRDKQEAVTKIVIDPWSVKAA
jgi:hypothetical protein